MTSTLRSRMAAAVLATLAAGGAMTAFAGPAAATTPVYDIVEYDTTSTVSVSKTATVDCPPNEVVLGTGVLQGADGQVAVEKLVPSRTSVTAYAHTDQDGYTGKWIFSVWAVCGAVPANYSIQSSPGSSSTTSATATVRCPGGTEVTGTGWDTTRGKADDGQVIVGDVLPYGQTTQATVDSVNVTARPDQDGTSGAFSATAYAVCSSTPGLHRVSTTGATSGSTMWRGAITDCPAGERVTGGGFTNGSNSGQVVLHSMAGYFNPSTNIGGLDTLMVEDQDGYSGNWDQIGWALCAKL